MTGVEEIVHEREASRWVLRLGTRTASVAEYRIVGDSYAIVHTETQPDLTGRGLAGRLVARALDDIRREGASVLPRCGFVAAYLREHPDQRDLVPARERQAYGLG